MNAQFKQKFNCLVSPIGCSIKKINVFVSFLITLNQGCYIVSAANPGISNFYLVDLKRLIKWKISSNFWYNFELSRFSFVLDKVYPPKAKPSAPTRTTLLEESTKNGSNKPHLVFYGIINSFYSITNMFL